jgi:hypothetical protein
VEVPPHFPPPLLVTIQVFLHHVLVVTRVPRIRIQTIRLFIKSKVVLLQSRDTYRPTSTLSLTSHVSLNHQTTVYDSACARQRIHQSRQRRHGSPLESKLPLVALVSARLEWHRLGEGLEWEGLLSRLARERVLRRWCRVVALADPEPLLGLLGHDDVLRG